MKYYQIGKYHLSTRNESPNKSKVKIPKENKIGDIASGGVVYFLDPESQKPKFLLLKHKGKKKHWDLPKGHLKKKETLVQAAVREVCEESGIPQNELILVKELEHKNIYSIRKHFSRKMKKIVHLFLFRSLTNKIKLSNEHTDYKWVKYEKLEKKLTYPNTSLPAFVESYEIISKKLETD